MCYPLLLALLLLRALGVPWAAALATWGLPAPMARPVWPFFGQEVLVPAVGFIAVSALRVVVGEPRPYESLDIEPLIQKDTSRRSFPSRHVFSAFVIAMAWLAWCVPVGVALLVASAILAVVRVLGGVHWPRDVVAGALMGVAAGLLLVL